MKEDIKSIELDDDMPLISEEENDSLPTFLEENAVENIDSEEVLKKEYQSDEDDDFDLPTLKNKTTEANDGPVLEEDASTLFDDISGESYKI